MPTPNPNRQATVGIEWAPTINKLLPIGLTPAPTVVLPATVDESISDLHLYLSVPVASGNVQPDPTSIVVDIYDASGADPAKAQGAPQTLYVVPASDGPVSLPAGAYFTATFGATTNLYQTVDEQVTAADDSNYTIYQSTDTGSHGIRFHGGASLKDVTTQVVTALTGKRIAAVHLRARLFNYNAADAPPVNITGVLGMVSPINGLVYEQRGDFYPAQSLKIATPTWSWRTNPVTGLPWSIGDIAQFLAGGAGDFGLRFPAVPPGGGNLIDIFAMQLEVVVVNETRVATGVVVPPSGVTGWANVHLLSPASGAAASWAKTSGHTYWIAPWRAIGSAQVSWATLMGDDLAGLSYVNLPLSQVGNGIPAGAPAAIHEDVAPAYALQIAGGVLLSGDSQGYVQRLDQPVSASSDMRQEISDLAAAPYGIWSAQLRAPAGAVPTAPLAISVIDLSASNALVCGPTQVYPSDLAVDDGRPHVVRGLFPVPFTPITTPTPHRYALLFASTTDDKSPWLISALQSVDDARTAGLHASLTYRGVTDAAVLDGTRDVETDLVATLQRTPAPVAGLTAALYVRPLAAGIPGGCTVGAHYGVLLSWQATDPGGTLAFYEVQRTDDLAGWQPIAALNDGSLAFYDFEGRRNVAAQYRVRQVRTDGAVSAWTPVVVATAPSTAEAFLFVSNQQPDLSLGYINDGGQHEFDFPGESDVQFHRLFGRDLQVGFRPLESRGVTMARTVVVGFAGSVWRKGYAAFDPIRQLVEASLPYVCMLDSDGNRFYVLLTNPKATREEPGGIYKADLTMTEVASTAAPVSYGWVPN